MPNRDLLSAAAGVGGGTDPYFDYVSLLLNGDGTNGAQNNTFTDSSNNNISLTRNGNLTQGSFNPYGNLWSNYVSGSYSSGNTGPYLKGGTSISLSGDFTLEGWFNIANPSSQGYFFNIGDDSTSSGMTFYFTSATNFRIYGNNATLKNFTVSAISSNTWYHIAFVRNSGVITLYIDGVAQDTYSNSASLSGYPYLFAEFNAGAYYGLYSGYVSNVRITNNAVYTSAFTPSTVPLTAISGTQFLTCQSNRFIDNSANNATITVTGSPAVLPFSPFNPTSAYDVTTTEGSGYFSTNSYINFGNYAQIGSSDFTFETWVYPYLGSSPYGGGGNIFTLGGDGNGYFGLAVGMTGTAYGFAVSLSSGSGWYSLATSTTPPINQWYHIAVTRSSGNIVYYVNGVAVLTGSFANSKTGSENYIGYYTNHSSNYDSFYGYLAGMRLVVGSVVYSGNFTPPTTPPAKITNTVLLPKFAEAGIYDYATQNDLQTVNGAQVSTSVKKYGTGSLYFDGSGSYLPTTYNQALAFGTGDFTIEFWMNSNNVSGASQKGMFQTSPTAGGLNHSYTGSVVIFTGTNSSGGPLDGGIGVAINNYTIISPGTSVLTTGTWYHIAVVRQSGTVYLYVNGVSVVSASNSANITGTYLALGAYYDTGYAYNGYLDDVRITSGLCRYPSGTTFTPPTAALPTF